MPDPLPLATDRHAVYRLGPDLLLVFKPRGHREAAHAHPYGQSLRVVRGLLAVERGGRVDLVAGDGALAVAANEPHATEAREDTWVVVASRPDEK